MRDEGGVAGKGRLGLILRGGLMASEGCGGKLYTQFLRQG